MDDDLVPAWRTLTFLGKALEGRPMVLHGIRGRGLTPTLEYRYGDSPVGPTPILTTRCLIMNRSYGEYFIREAPKAAHLIERGIPKWNGEDIYLSLLSIHRTGELPRAYRLPYWNVWWTKSTSIMRTRVPPDSPDLLAHRDYRRWFTRSSIEMLELGPTIGALVAESRAEGPP